MKKLLFIIIAICFITSCNKKEVPAGGFSVTADKTSYKANDTVTFSFTGNPWYLTFYSGEPGKKFMYSDRVAAEGTPQLQFTSYRQTGSQANTLRILVSTNFSGVYDSASMYNATWTDITEKAKLSTGSDNTASGVVNLSQFIANDRPAYIAFKYLGFKDASAQRTWTIKNITLNNVLPDKMSYSILTSAESTAGFQQVNMKTDAVKWTISSTQLQVKGGTTANSPEAEAWVVSKALVLNKVTPDVGVPLKNMTTVMNLYKYIYTTPGTYTATLVGSNINRYDNTEDIRELTIKVE